MVTDHAPTRGKTLEHMGYQTNLMVFGPGGYKFTDFLKKGVPLTIALAPLVWPF